MTPVRLGCPLCGATIRDGETPPRSGDACPTCGARILGDGAHVVEAARTALVELGVDAGPERFARGLFEVVGDHPLARRIAITSDERTDFYHWWIVVAADEDVPSLVGEVVALVPG